MVRLKLATDNKESFIESYNKFRDAYLKVGELLQTNQGHYERIEQNQAQIFEIITKEWGY